MKTKKINVFADRKRRQNTDSSDNSPDLQQFS